jgi:predicted RNase H-like HicB family nuclease
MEHAIKMAKEALGLHYWGMEKDGDELPEPTYPPYEDMEKDDFVIPIEIFPDIVKGAIENKAIKKTLTIPYWLNAEAEAADVNFSQLLQNALKEYLHIGA